MATNVEAMARIPKGMGYSVCCRYVSLGIRKRKFENMSQIKLAEAQLIGFAHASKGFTIKELADSMALTKREWIKLRDSINLKPLDKVDLDEKYGVK